MEERNKEDIWNEIEEHGAPCGVRLLCSQKKTYTGPGKEYVPLWSVEDQHVPVQLEELRRGKKDVLWGRLKSGMGWIELIDVELWKNE